MWISDFAIKRPLVTVVMMLILVAFGLVSLWRLETDEFPEINPPFLLVGVLYPGAAPDGVEREILDPIEEAIQGISGVEQITGQALDSYASIFIQFEFGKDPQEATNEVRDAITSIRQDLPTEMEEPLIRRFSPNDLPIISIALSSDRLSTAQLTQLADRQVARELRGIPGIARVDIAGEQERELSINLQPDALASAGISPAQVVQALQTQNLAAPVGRLNADATEQAIRLEGRLESLDAFARIPVGTGTDGRTIYLGEVAAVEDAAEEARTLALYNGRESVGIDIVKTNDASTTTVSDAVRARLAEISATLPEGTRADLVKDSGERVAASVSNVYVTLLEGLFLTVLVVFIFLNSWRSTVITGLALPVSMIASFMAVYAAGFTLNTMSLLGLTLAIGIIIDDAIVVRENIVRHVEMGKSHLQASREGTAEIGLAVAATTFSIVAVFVPIGFIEGIAGQWFQPFALTIATSVLVSLFVSFSLDPMLSAYWADPHQTEEEKVFITRWLDGFNHWFDKQADRYRRVIAWALDHPKSVLLLTFATFAGAILIPILGLVGGGFFPEDDTSEVNLMVKTPPGSSLAYTQSRMAELEQAARAHPEVRYTYATIATQSGAVDEGSVYIRLTPMGERERSQTEMTRILREELSRVPGVEVAVSNGFDAAKQIQLQLRGTDRELLQRAAEDLAARVRAVPGAVDVGLSTRGRRPELAVDIDRDAAMARGVDVASIAFSLRPAFAGIDAGDWVDPDGETRDVVVRYAPEYRASSETVEFLPLRVPGPQGPTTVTLNEVATIRNGLGAAVIQHLDGDPVITVEANVGTGANLSGVIALINEDMEAHPLPPGVTLSQGGEAADQAEVFTSLLTALLSGILLMYLVLVLQFGSFLDPLAILVSLPLSLIGVMLGLMVAGATLNIMSMIGVILLMGIVAKNAILLVDFADELKRQGMPTREALIEAGGIRLRPILMTTFALVAGMIPIAIGHGEGALFRRPLGAAVIGGVITSTVLTLLVIPTIYEIFDGWRTKLGARVRRFLPAPEHPAPEAPAPAPTPAT